MATTIFPGATIRDVKTFNFRQSQVQMVFRNLDGSLKETGFVLSAHHKDSHKWFKTKKQAIKHYWEQGL